MPKRNLSIVYLILLIAVFIGLIFAIFWASGGMERGLYATKLIKP
jgi:hypothetical protein